MRATGNPGGPHQPCGDVIAGPGPARSAQRAQAAGPARSDCYPLGRHAAAGQVGADAESQTERA